MSGNEKQTSDFQVKTLRWYLANSIPHSLPHTPPKIPMSEKRTETTRTADTLGPHNTARSFQEFPPNTRSVEQGSDPHLCSLNLMVALLHQWKKSESAHLEVGTKSSPTACMLQPK